MKPEIMFNSANPIPRQFELSEKEALSAIACMEKEGYTDWDGVPNTHIKKATEKAYFVNVILLPCPERKIDESSDFFQSLNWRCFEMRFWIPKKLMSRDGSVPFFFLKEKLMESCK